MTPQQVCMVDAVTAPTNFSIELFLMLDIVKGSDELSIDAP